MTASVIAQTAREWLGTPYRHQCSVKGVGCDCLGLLRGLWREHLGQEPQRVPAYSSDWDEVARSEVLLNAAKSHLILKPAADLAPGDVLLFRMRRDAVAKHIGIYSNASPAKFIHAYSGHGVVESSLSSAWLRRLDSVFAFPATS